MEAAILGALLIGLCLGLLGSGGSILTIPVLVLFLERPEKLAVAEGLAIVGCVAFIGALPYFNRKEISWRSVLFFGLPGMVGACAGSCASNYINSEVQLMLFALAMFTASGFILFGPKGFDQIIPSRISYSATLVKGFFIGCLTGLLGVGGGFLIVPALMILCELPLRTAVGTSLVIITLNSFTGLIERLASFHEMNLHVNWPIIGLVSVIAILGSFAGSFASHLLPQIMLRKILGGGIFIMGVGILVSQW